MNKLEDPEYYDLLSPLDRNQYRALSKMFRESIQGRQRNHRIENFNELLDMIRNFAQRGDGDDWKRCLVCGVVFFKNNQLAINTHQLSLIYNKCKSSINGALKHLGWKTTISRGDLDPQLIDFFPILKDQTQKLRQWSVRENEQVLPSCPSVTNVLNSNNNIVEKESETPIIELNEGSKNSMLIEKSPAETYPEFVSNNTEFPMFESNEVLPFSNDFNEGTLSNYSNLNFDSLPDLFPDLDSLSFNFFGNEI